MHVEKKNGGVNNTQKVQFYIIRHTSEERFILHVVWKKIPLCDIECPKFVYQYVSIKYKI